MRTLFEEKQHFTQWWLWGLLIAVTAIILGTFGMGLYTQLVLGEPWGDRPMGDEALILVALLSISFVLLVVILLFNSTLEIVVDTGGVSYRFPPILIRNWKRIEREDIESYEIRRYYLRGYGVRWDLMGNRTINVKGNVGIEFKIRGRKKLLLGTQNPNEFFAAVDKMKKRSED